ncbi:tricarballylate utilization 4Fe-4S protein TcuB [Roseomonas sp. CAU 1739]|uniref:tricarballylate utilization 4Fe-4S protein TcuB n=1 Tax=Roseomonas sp. CAU 1739 TaxID=3140364 RepID=UPI00325B84BE
MAQESETIAEARRQMEICNSCRYCEGYCAVFPAMAMRRSFAEADLTHLANLCHGCKGCYHACQYAPPHAFGINIPATFAEIRNETYAKHAWPGALGAMFERNGTVVALAASLGVALLLILTVALQDPAVLWSAQRGAGAFFRIIPHWLMIGLGVLTFGYAILAMAMGARSYWRATGGGGAFAPAPAAEAMVDIATMRNLGGGGHGCNDIDDSFSVRRRWLHQALMYGFLLCFAATCTGTIYHYLLGWTSPHAFFSLPVQFGTWGGVLMMIGAAGLAHVKVITDPGPVSRKVMGGEFAILGLLFLIAVTGLLLLVVRHTGAMGLMLAIHLGLVFAFFLVMPYSKMVHGVYRGIALLRNAQEKRRAATA